MFNLELTFAGNSLFYRIQSIKKESGIELLSGGSKNDYDWYKTHLLCFRICLVGNFSEVIFMNCLVKA